MELNLVSMQSLDAELQGKKSKFYSDLRNASSLELVSTVAVVQLLCQLD